MLKETWEIIKRYPPLFRALRPIVDSSLRVREALIGGAVRWRKQLSSAHLPTMHAAAAGGWRVQGIGSKALGREIVMLVVSDLRVDPRV